MPSSSPDIISKCADQEEKICNNQSHIVRDEISRFPRHKDLANPIKVREIVPLIHFHNRSLYLVAHCTLTMYPQAHVASGQCLKHWPIGKLYSGQLTNHSPVFWVAPRWSEWEHQGLLTTWRGNDNFSRPNWSTNNKYGLSWGINPVMCALLTS